MDIIEGVEEVKLMRQAVVEADRVGFVPTMGCLHAGHEALIKRSIDQNDVTIVTIYVNPAQFDDPGDLRLYPGILQDDLALLRGLGVDIVWLPQSSELYADDYAYRVTETHVGKQLEGLCRPEHFDGVLSVVLKLLLVLRPHRVYFGEKDYQQLLLVKGMVRAFFLDVEVIGCPTVRTAEGLALSSRHARLSAEQLFLARRLHEILVRSASCDEARGDLLTAGFEVEYVSDQWGRRLAAVSVAGVRLIDNIKLTSCINETV